MRHYNEATGHLEMTMADWKRLHKDFKGIMRPEGGKPYRTALYLTPNEGTCLVPVDIVEEAA